MKTNQTILRLHADITHRFRNHRAIAGCQMPSVTVHAPTIVRMTVIMCIQLLISIPFRSHLTTTAPRQRCPRAPTTTTKPIATFCRCKKKKRSKTGWPQKSLCTHESCPSPKRQTLYFLVSFRISDKLKYSQSKELEHHVEDIVSQRQEFAKKAYADWLEKKKRHAAAVKVVSARCKLATAPEPEVKSFVKDCPPHEAWLKKKNKIEQTKRSEESLNQKAHELDKTTQMQRSIEMYKKWLAQSKLRNKPVPFGQGLLSMRRLPTTLNRRNPINFEMRKFNLQV